MDNKQPTSKNLANELNNLEYNYEQEMTIDFTLNLCVNCFINLLLITGQNAKQVIEGYIKGWSESKTKELEITIDHMYKAIKEKKIDYPIGKQAHLEHAMKSLQVVLDKVEMNFSHILNTSGLVSMDGSPMPIILDSDKKPS